MPTKKIADITPVKGKSWVAPEQKCFHVEHNPPNHQVFSDGVYEHTCPGCGYKTVFVVRSPHWESPVPRFDERAGYSVAQMRWLANSGPPS